MGDQSDNIITDLDSVERYPLFVPRPSPSAIPIPGIFDDPLVCLIINQKWAAHFRGVIEALDQPDTWIGTDEEIEAARQQIREALVKFGQECMICCDETNELLQQLIDLQAQVVADNVVIIEQNYTQEYNQYVNAYNQFVTNNQNTQILNEMLYTGAPTDIYPEAGADFDSNGDGNLCAAIEAYINAQIYTHTQEAAALAFAGGALATVILGLAAAAALISGGASVLLGVAVNTAIFASMNIWNDILHDTSAIRKVKCCMFDALNGQPLTEAAFQTSVDSCGFDSGTNESTLAAQIASDNFNYPENWTAFLRAMNQSSATDAEACTCDCDDEIVIEDFAGTGCIITPMGNCIYKFTQPTVVDGWHYFSLRDIASQCLFVELAPEPYFTAGVGTGTVSVDCAGVESTFPGGFAPGEGRSAHWRQGEGNPITYYKITLAE